MAKITYQQSQPGNVQYNAGYCISNAEGFYMFGCLQYVSVASDKDLYHEDWEKEIQIVHEREILNCKNVCEN